MATARPGGCAGSLWWRLHQPGGALGGVQEGAGGLVVSGQHHQQHHSGEPLPAAAATQDRAHNVQGVILYM